MHGSYGFGRTRTTSPHQKDKAKQLKDRNPIRKYCLPTTHFFSRYVAMLNFGKCRNPSPLAMAPQPDGRKRTCAKAFSLCNCCKTIPVINFASSWGCQAGRGVWIKWHYIKQKQVLCKRIVGFSDTDINANKTKNNRGCMNKKHIILLKTHVRHYPITRYTRP